MQMRDVVSENKVKKERPDGQDGKILKILSIPAGAAKLAAALACVAFTHIFIYFGCEDYLMNRSGAVLAGCFLAVVILQFFAGEMVLPMYTAIGWRIPAFEAGFWVICFFVARDTVRFVSWFTDTAGIFLPLMDADVSIVDNFGMAVYLIALFCFTVCPFSLFSRYRKKSFFYFLMMAAWVAVMMTAGVHGGGVNERLLVVMLVLLTASYFAGFLRYLAAERIKAKRMPGRRQILGKRVAVIVLAGGILLGFGMYASEDAPEIRPRQDEEGYYLLCTREGFEWFIRRTNLENEEHNVNVRLTADIVLNDTSNWENWAEEAPEYQYDGMVSYSGHFDGNGHTLEGYYSGLESPIFIRLEKEALVTDLKIRNSLFQSTYGESGYVNDDGEVDVFSAAALCFSNEGRIEGCDVEAVVLGDWSAGGIANVNYGTVENCRFAGKVEAGRWFCGDRGDESWAVSTIRAGGICRTNGGSIRNCLNEGAVSCGAVTDTYYVRYAVGGIAGQICEEGSVEDCRNAGDIRGPQFSGGIAGSSTGEIYQCANTGKVHVEQSILGQSDSLITAGICASNGGLVDSCWNTGEVSIRQDFLSFYAPVYGIACNLVNSMRGRTENCYYLPEKAEQEYRQSGVYKLSETEMAEVRKYVAAGQDTAKEGPDRTKTGQDEPGEKNDTSDKYVISDVDSWELFSEFPDFPGTDEDDYIHLHMGPEEDTAYEVQPGDTLWKIAESFYGDGNCYENLVRPGDSEGNFGDSDLIHPGEEICVPGLDYYLLCANDEEGFPWFYYYWDTPGENCPLRHFMAKPEDWYYGSINFAANRGLDALWPKDRGTGRSAAGDIRILYYLDGNPEGDFLAGEWESTKEKIAESAGIYCGQGLEDLRFYRYELDDGESLYGYSFRLYPDRCPYESELQKEMDEALNCAVFYRLREGLLAEFIGIEPAAADMDVLARTRYLAARVVDDQVIEEKEYTGEEFYGRENWPCTELHNPFAVALEYSREKECSAYMSMLRQLSKGP